MIELPEAQTLARQLAGTLGGKTVRGAVAGATPHGFAFYNVPQAEFGPMLEGRAVTGAAAYGGHVELELGGGMRLSFHDGANIRYYTAGDQIPAKHQLYMEFDDGGFLACTVSMYAGFSVYEEGTNANPYYLTAKEKPSPFTPEFDRPYFAAVAQAAGPKVSLKALLATEQRIPGLGNGCLQDILFAARQNPQTKLAALSDGGLDTVYESMKTTLAAMAMGGGRDTEKDLFGKPGGYRSVLSAKTFAFPCPVCGGAITRKAYMGGNVYFCAACQPVRK